MRTLRLPHIIAAADASMLQDILCNCTDGAPFLLQPLVDAPSLLQVPGPINTQRKSTC